MRFYLMPLLFFSFILTQAQESSKIQFYKLDQLDQPPLYENCNISDSEVCTFEKINSFIQKEFDQTLLTDSVPEKEKIMLATFFVDTVGKVVHPIIHGKNKDLNRELARIIKEIPVLKPGIKNNRPVNTMISLSVKVSTTSPKDLVYSFDGPLDSPPYYKGCENNKHPKKCTSEKIQKFIFSNRQFFKIKAPKGQWLKTVVHFTIDEQGKVINISAQGTNKLLNAEAEKTVKRLDIFVPGIVNGKPVKVSYSLPIMMKK